MKIVELRKMAEKRFVFDCQWDRFGLVLGKGEFVCYSLDVQKDMEVEITFASGYPGGVLFFSRKEESDEVVVSVESEQKKITVYIKKGKGEFIVRVLDGEVCLEKLEFREKSMW